MKRSKLRKEKIHNVQFEEKWSPRKRNGPKFRAQRHKRFKEKPNAKWNKGDGDLRARPHPAKLPTCEKELKKYEESPQQ